MAENEFIDPENDFGSEKNSFEEIMLNQIRETAKALSEDLTLAIVKNEKTGMSYKEDRRKVAINHIVTLQHLMFPFIEGSKEEEFIDGIETDLEEYSKKYGETKTIIQGKGMVSYKNMVHNIDSLPYNHLLEYKLEKYKIMFGILVYSYKKNKDEIAALSYE